MIYNLKNIRTWNARNGYGMEATLVINNKEVCTMTDLGDGSHPQFNVKEQKAFDQLTKTINELPEMFLEVYGCELKIDVCMFIDLLNYALETKTEFKLLSA